MDASGYNADRDKFRGNVGMMKTLSVGDGKKLLLGKRIGKSRGGEFEKGFLCQIYTRKIRIWGCDMAEISVIRKTIR